jgi:UPF0271 protein
MGLTVDLNCDLGEGAGQDEALMPLVTSANLACGAHAGDAATMRATVRLAQRHGVRIGAHPGFEDRANFGRLETEVTPEAVAGLVRRQWSALVRIALEQGAAVGHVKLHGALYNQTARDPALAAAVIAAIREMTPRPVLVALAGSKLEHLARSTPGVVVVAEVFSDRTYQPDGTLTPRSRPDALITDPVRAVAQVLRMVREGKVRATDGRDVAIRADTVCLHGDGAHAVEFARRLRNELAAADIAVRAFAP